MFRATFLMAWRNLWRAPRRTGLTAAALALGVMLMLFSTAYSEGMTRRMIDGFTGAFAGHAQVHAKGYRQQADATLLLPRPKALLGRALSLPQVRAATLRLYSEGLAAMGDRASGVTVVGADFNRERRVSGWQRRLVRGRLPRAPHEALVGHALARTLDIAPGSPLVLTVPQLRGGELSYQRLTVTGLLFTGQEEVDKTGVIAPLAALQTWLGAPGAAHELVVRVRGDYTDEKWLRAVLGPLRREGLEVLPWHRLQPALAQMQALQGVWLFIALLIIYFLIGLGVVNTLAMSLLERRREFGVLKAIGTPPWRLCLMVAMEALCLGLVGAGAGLVLGLSAVGATAITGMPMGQVEIMGMTFREALFPVLTWWSTVWVCAAFVLLTPLASVGIALRAALVDPVSVLRGVG